MTSEIGEVWDQIQPAGAGQLQGRLAPASSNVWLAVDAGGRRHALVEAPGAPPGRPVAATKGLSAVTAELEVAGQPVTRYVDVTCLDVALNEMFVAVVSDLVRAAAATPADGLVAVKETLATWRWFWGVEVGLTGEEVTGLFGELWFMLQWAQWPAVIDRWIGPSGAVHDFASDAASVEVKTTRVRADGRAVHRIANLDQLAGPDSGHLYLFSLQLMPDALAANSLPNLVVQARQRVADHPAHLAALLEKLAAARYNPAHEDRYQQTFRVVAEEVYTVTPGFPKLTRQSFTEGLPQGIGNVSYSLDLAACGDYLIADAHHRAGATFLHDLA